MPRLASRTVYAIKIGTHVEFRASFKPLKALISKLSRPMTFTYDREIYVDDPDNPYGGTYVMKPYTVNKNMVLKQTFFVGGTVMGYMKLTKFRRIFKLSPKPDTLLKLKPEAGRLVLNPKWRKLNLA